MDSPSFPFTLVPLTTFHHTEAISELPSDAQVGVFHTDGPRLPYSRFALPVTETAGRCKVRVAMDYAGTEDQGSWAGMRAAATELNMRCAREKGLYYGGGRIWAGHSDRIVIVLSRAGRYAVEGNGTLEIGET